MEEKITETITKSNPLTTVTPLSKSLALIVFVSLPFLGFYLGMGYQRLISPSSPSSTLNVSTEKPQPKTSSSDVNQSTPSATNETSNWKTYTNTQDSYSIKYPDESLLRLVCQGEGLALVVKQSGYSGADPLEMPTCARDSRYTIEVSVTTVSKTPPQSMNDYVVTQQPIVIGEVVGTKYTVVRQPEAIGPGEEWYVEIISQHNGKFYDFYLGDRKLQTVFDQVLSTLRFN